MTTVRICTREFDPLLDPEEHGASPYRVLTILDGFKDESLFLAEDTGAIHFFLFGFKTFCCAKGVQ